jgi:hypothetical protein
VVRVKRDILRRSAIGGIYTDRSLSTAGAGGSRLYGVDGVFSFYQNVNINTYIAKTDTPGESGQDVSYRAQLDYNADRYGFQAERLAVAENFTPDVGFLRRTAFTRNSAYVRFSPRPRSTSAVRKLSWEGLVDYITNPDGRLESRLAQAAFRTELQNGDSIGVEAADSFELLDQPFEISRGVVLPVGGYSFPEAHLIYNFGPQRKISGNVAFEHGAFYDGTRTGISTGRARVEITSRLSVEPGVSVNWIRLPHGEFTDTLVATRTTFTLTPRMSASALTQYSSGAHTFNSNARFRWEYQPGSDLFVVYTDNRDTVGTRVPLLRNRGVVVKLTRLFRM